MNALEKPLLDHPIEKTDEMIVVAASVEESAWFAMQ